MMPENYALMVAALEEALGAQCAQMYERKDDCAEWIGGHAPQHASKKSMKRYFSKIKFHLKALEKVNLANYQKVNLRKLLHIGTRLLAFPWTLEECFNNEKCP